ncbi:MAG: glutamate racemase [Cyanobacteria bacterium SIG32]|nr:glutamate racemase [Cyanobacteria bacterium SIG32]
MLKESKITLKTTNRPIAFFDSGVGGLTVYTKLKSLLPEENYIYFGDTKHMPYGEKTEAELLEYADNIFNFFLSKNVKAVVMACNTTSSVIYDKIKDKYNVKIYPIIQSAANIFAQLPVKKIGVFATPATIKSNVYKQEIQKHNPDMEVIQIACPEWVRIVEEHRINQPQSILQIQEKLNEMLEYKPEKIILGCTHYPYLSKVLNKFAQQNDLFIDPSEYFAEFIKNDLIKNNLAENSQSIEEIYVSASPENFKESAKMFYDIKTIPTLALCD